MWRAASAGAGAPPLQRRTRNPGASPAAPDGEHYGAVGIVEARHAKTENREQKQETENRKRAEFLQPFFVKIDGLIFLEALLEFGFAAEGHCHHYRHNQQRYDRGES